MSDPRFNGSNEAKLVGAGDDDSNDRYTEGGINVVALDRKGRGLHRARPERRLGSDRFPRTTVPPARVVPIGFIVIALVAVGATIVWIVS